MKEDTSMSNIQKAPQKPKFSVAITTPAYRKLINDTLQDVNRVRRFTAAITSAVSANPELQDCEAGTILSGALLGESLNLSPSPQLGQYYLVPFNTTVKDENGKDLLLTDDQGNRVPVLDDKGKQKKYNGYPLWEKRTIKKAVFQLGYKGYIQLAVRSGFYKKLNVLAVKEGELIRFDPLNEEIEVDLIQDEILRENTETIGYYAMFEYLNGFKKAMYWSKEKMEAHALKYSKGYAAKKGYTFWEKDFDGMAYKTMLRQLISKWGIMSIEMQNAYEGDMASIDGEKKSYIDNDDNDEPIASDITLDDNAAEENPNDNVQDAEVVNPKSKQVSINDI